MCFGLHEVNGRVDVCWVKGDLLWRRKLRFFRGMEVGLLCANMFVDCGNHFEGICVEVVRRRECCCEMVRNPEGDDETGFASAARRARRV